MLSTLVVAVLVILVCGILVWGIDALPAIDATFKQFAKVVIIVLAALFVVLVIYHAVVGTPLPLWR